MVPHRVLPLCSLVLVAAATSACTAQPHGGNVEPDRGGSSGNGGSQSSAGQAGSGGGNGATNQGGDGSGGAAAGSGGGGASGSGSGGTGIIPTCDGNSTDVGTIATDSPGVWQPMLQFPKDTQPISGDGLAADPARPSDFYFFYEENQTNGAPRHVLKSTDFGATWVQIDETPVVGNPWGVAIDPNPCRDPNTPPTLYTPAGYGDGGIWKSTDGGAVWTNLFAGVVGGVVPKAGGGTTTFPADKNGYHVDFYQVHVLPDDPPNHILITYHYPAPDQPAPLGESKDGGQTWEVHLLPAGDSHYVFGIDTSTWIVLSGEGSNGGVYRTTTAGRVGGEISMDAWVLADGMEHPHGSFTPFYDRERGHLYFAGKQGLKRSTDAGENWEVISNESTFSALAGTNSNLYALAFLNDKVESAPLDDPASLSSMLVPTGDSWWGGTPPFGIAGAFDGTRGVVIKAEYAHCSNNCLPPGAPLLENGEIWRYVEP
jgi:hypothetical protein